jgi:hypothetical protein
MPGADADPVLAKSLRGFFEVPRDFFVCAVLLPEQFLELQYADLFGDLSLRPPTRYSP